MERIPLLEPMILRYQYGSLPNLPTIRSEMPV